MSGLAAHLNSLPPPALEAALSRCCASRCWISGMTERVPYESDASVLDAAERIWWSLGPSDWLEAFEAHPKIGERGVGDGWSRAEQAGVDHASDATLAALARGNGAYEERFGFIFLICASGLRAEELLAALETRLENPPTTELRVAAGEQARIARLRLERLVEDPEVAQARKPRSGAG